MGMSFFGNCSKTVDNIQISPDIKEFTIEKTKVISPYVIVLVHYPSCTNLEGRKIMVYHAQLEDILNAKELDPHFEDENGPIARFKPGGRGWLHAQLYVNAIL